MISNIWNERRRRENQTRDQDILAGRTQARPVRRENPHSPCKNTTSAISQLSHFGITRRHPPNEEKAQCQRNDASTSSTRPLEKAMPKVSEKQQTDPPKGTDEQYRILDCGTVPIGVSGLCRVLPTGK